VLRYDYIDPPGFVKPLFAELDAKKDRPISWQVTPAGIQFL
jgi:hypothetical protein